MVDVDPDIADPIEYAKFTALTGDPMAISEKHENTEQPTADQAEGESAEPETVETEEEQSPAVDVELLATSTQALKRYGITAAMLNKMSPDEIIEAGGKLKKIQEDNDTAQTELKTLRLTKEKPAGDDKTPATQAADLSKWNKKLAEKLGIDEADAPILAEFVRDLVGPIQSRLEAAEAREAQRMIDSAVQKVGAEFPIVLEDANAKDKLLKKAQQISGAYDNEHECLVDAAKILGYETAAAIKAKGASKAKETARAADASVKKNGLLTANGRAPSTSALSKEDLEFKAFLQLEQGNQPEFQRLIALSKRAAV